MTRTIVATLALALAGCGTLRDINEIALDACELFAAEHPVEMRGKVEELAPRYSASAEDSDAFSPKALCAIPVIADLFLADQKAQLARLSRDGTRGGECP